MFVARAPSQKQNFVRICYACGKMWTEKGGNPINKLAEESRWVFNNPIGLTLTVLVPRRGEEQTLGRKMRTRGHLKWIAPWGFESTPKTLYEKKTSGKQTVKLKWEVVGFQKRTALKIMNLTCLTLTGRRKNK